MSDSIDIVQRIKEDKRVKYMNEMEGGRHVIHIPLSLIETHPKLSKIRGKDPKEVDFLTQSMARTGNTSVYPIAIYAEFIDNVLRFYVADGGQRLRAGNANHIEAMSCMVVSRWQTVDDALNDAVQLQWGRYAPTDRDLLSLAKVMTVRDLAEFSGNSETTIARFAAVARHEWSWSPVEDGVLGYPAMASLLKACNNNPDKFAALQNTLTEKHRWAKSQAKKWKDKLSQKKRDWDRKSRDKTKVSSYFKGFKWNSWVSLLTSDDGVTRDENGRFVLRLDGEKPKGVAVLIGDPTDWEKEIAVYKFFGAKVDDVAVEDIDEVLQAWPDIRQNLETIRRRKLHVEAHGEHPHATHNPITTPVTPPEPEPQTPKMNIGRRPTDD